MRVLKQACKSPISDLLHAIMISPIISPMISRRKFGELPDGRDVHAFDLLSDTGLRASFIEYGASLQSLRLPSGLDVVLGFDDLAGYLGQHPCFGAAIGRVANRISGARFELGGETIILPANDGAHNLHSGPNGFDRALWHGEVQGDKLVFTHISPDGHQSFPGRVTAQMIVSLEGNTLSLDMTARSDKVTPINLTHHSYFNLTDGGKTPITDHELTILCEAYLEMDAENIPTGRIMANAGTNMDYRAGKTPSPRLDDCFVKHHDAANISVKKLAKLTSKTTGNMLIICSTQPAIQAYSGAHIPNIIGKSTAPYGPNHGIALEPQNFPNAVNETSFPSPLLEPETLYHQTIRYTLKTKKGH